MSLLHDHLLLERVADGVHVRLTDRTWWGHDAQFGGYVEALAIVAMRAELDAPEMTPVTTSIQFFRPFLDGELRVEVEVLRRGRTMANAHARLFSQGRLAGQATASFGVRRARAEFVAAQPPRELHDAPLAPEEPDTPSRLGVPTHAHFQFFPRIGDFRIGSGSAGVVGGWVRPRFATPVDEALLVILQDLWLPAAYHHWREPTV
ncbi:MAG TPA: thioesterase family protein, partial [Acidimicrobiales bacterium]